ncbi:hypothetical protein HBI56_093280 [Parastagonospora nodorum]|uniref:Mid2 domain-containing protein n=2 Tax=Phaeosphaeria nodorum (strain SN15 / ATCC MYA-4574 / FGSC 10173) TaxID=321614 RepID=A0A7U2F3J6_PHANO|nr:hypothetical protein SNOG_04175 [Parastagonospora nodorum SN15]KAH3914376.1 hypothetical protein HBH56_088560 [Parastagonospora nodorum]EAT87935.1 hypothetical protein SNOG_04175 [Parastagonospora nodorum SN15]KAH3936106.1 hypothetical protein HBH54_023200 [Parastagonospora nodorum]KAH3945608.1 hypothetical protein HBH53_140300 [Parastagonospora nodorum]KAH4057459.1 hypothetical protein HBH49_046540 [Parastagonospora nodorum]
MADHSRRQDTSCRFGGTWYRCSSDFGGFSGCCTMDPCSRAGGCPKEKDMTPGRNTLAATRSATTTTASSRVSEASFVKLPIPSTSYPRPTTASYFAAGTTDTTLATAYVTLDHVPSATSSHTAGPTSNSLPIAAIFGVAIGGVALIGLAVFLFMCRRRRKQKNIYQAPIYVSPFNTNSNMYQKRDGTYRSSLRGPSFDTQDLSTRDSGVHTVAATAPSPHRAELPGESGLGTH